MLELSLFDLPMGTARDNFQKILEAFRGLVIETGNWRFYELTFTAAVTNYRFKHNLTFTPKDIIQTSRTGAGAITFNHTLFNGTFIDITTTGACIVRFFIGRKSESATFGSPGATGSGSGGGAAGLFFVADTNSIDLTASGATISADLRISTDAATAGFFKATTTIKSGGSPGLHVEAQIATTSQTGFLSSTDWTTFNAKASFSFVTIACTSGTNPVADAASDTLTLTAGTGISITGDAATDTVTIAATGGASSTGFTRFFPVCKYKL